MAQTTLMFPKECLTFEVATGADCSQPGIYRWTIEGGDNYIEKQIHTSAQKRI
jgi:hypothetical protein